VGREEKIAKLKELQAKVEQNIADVVSNDPFWGFEPTTEVVTPGMKGFLGGYLRDEDIPLTVDGQLDVILSDSEIKLVGGGNQSGKSLTEIIEGVIDTVGVLPPSLKPYSEKLGARIERAKSKYVRGRVLAVDYKQLNNTVLPSWRQWFPRKYLKNGSWSDSFMASHNLLKVWDGKKEAGQVEFMTNQMDIDSFQGPPLDWLKGDEEMKEAIYKENLLRFVTSDRLNVAMYYTPTHGLSWSVDLAEAENADYFKLCTISNPKANLDAVRSIISDDCHSYEEIKMRLLGEFISLSGLIYGQSFDRKIHIVEPFPITYQDYIVNRGLDPHASKPTYCVELATDRECHHHVIGTYVSRRGADTEEIKADLAERALGYRLGRTICDVSANYDIKIMGGVNVYRELKTGRNAIPALQTSEKFSGSILSGVNEIKKNLKPNERGVPSLVIFNNEENQLLIKAMRTLEREKYANEDIKGEKDAIAEGKHDAHACLRYLHQMNLGWLPPAQRVPEPPQREVYI